MKSIINKEKIVANFETSVSIINLRSDGIVKIVVKDKVEIDLKDSLEIFEITRKFADGKNLLILVIAGVDSTVTAPARDFSASDASSAITMAEAIVIRSLAQKLVVNFILKFYKPKRAMKMFTREEDAIEWLYKFKLN